MQSMVREDLVVIEEPEADGLLDYLRTLYRVAHAPGASHWCTPGHNRGRALADSATPIRPLAPVLFPVGEEAR